MAPVAEHIKRKELLQRGDQIGVAGVSAGMKYYHHGIYIGNNMVIDFGVFGDQSKSKAKPRKVTLDDFTTDPQGEYRPLIRINWSSSDAADTVVARAEDLYKNPEKWEGYNLLFNNCEHFATYCKTGQSYSQQVVDEMKKSFLERLLQLGG